MWMRCCTVGQRRPSSSPSLSRESSEPLHRLVHIKDESNERTQEGSHHRRGIRSAFCRPALELKSRGRDADRPAKLSSFPTTSLSGCDGLAVTGRDRLSAPQRAEPAEEYSCLAGNRRGCGP